MKHPIYKEIMRAESIKELDKISQRIMMMGDLARTDMLDAIYRRLHQLEIGFKLVS